MKSVFFIFLLQLCLKNYAYSEQCIQKYIESGFEYSRAQQMCYTEIKGINSFSQCLLEQQIKGVSLSIAMSSQPCISFNSPAIKGYVECIVDILSNGEKTDYEDLGQDCLVRLGY